MTSSETRGLKAPVRDDFARRNAILSLVFFVGDSSGECNSDLSLLGRDLSYSDNNII